MNIQLIDGEFPSADALDLLTQLVHVKINYQELKISKSEVEEDIKNRESKIIRLQRALDELRTQLNGKTERLRISANIHIN
jgi:hypothetical protein